MDRVQTLQPDLSLQVTKTQQGCLTGSKANLLWCSLAGWELGQGTFKSERDRPALHETKKPPELSINKSPPALYVQVLPTLATTWNCRDEH